MSTEAPAEMMRYGPMRDWLKENGISEYEVLKLIGTGAIRAGKLREPTKKKQKVRSWYSASQIKRDVLGNGEQEKTPNAQRPTPNASNQKRT